MGRAAAGQLGVCFLLVSVSGCLSHQSRNSIRRTWVDFNSLGQPTVSFEQTDHLPYHAERVGHFQWMYGGTPGHQNVYKIRRYQKDLQAGGEMVTPGEMAGTVESPPSKRDSAPVLPVPPQPKPPPPPVDVPAAPEKNSARPDNAPLVPPVPAPPKPAKPFPSKRQGPSAQKSAPNGWTASRKERK